MFPFALFMSATKLVIEWLKKKSKTSLRDFTSRFLIIDSVSLHFLTDPHKHSLGLHPQREDNSFLHSLFLSYCLSLFLFLSHSFRLPLSLSLSLSLSPFPLFLYPSLFWEEIDLHSAICTFQPHWRSGEPQNKEGPSNFLHTYTHTHTCIQWVRHKQESQN